MGNGDKLELEVGAVFGGRYEIVRRIGAGGMGAVYEVLDQRTNRERALKVMLPSVVADAELRRRFAREATVAAKIRSEHIAETLDAAVDEATGAPFIVLELLEGQELEDRVQEQGAMPPREVVHYLVQAASALDQAHLAGIVHRDLKPENLFITYRDDGTPRVKLLDFGIAKVTSGTVSGQQTQGVLGTPLYMAPEQAHGEIDVSAKADIYAMAHVAYTLLVGEAYFTPELQDADSIIQFVMCMLKGPQELPSVRSSRRRGVQLPAAFDTWFLAGSSPNPADRPDSVGELAESLADALGVAIPRTSMTFEGFADPAAHQPVKIDPLAETSLDQEARTTQPLTAPQLPNQPAPTHPTPGEPWPQHSLRFDSHPPPGEPGAPVAAKTGQSPAPLGAATGAPLSKTLSDAVPVQKHRGMAILLGVLVAGGAVGGWALTRRAPEVAPAAAVPPEEPDAASTETPSPPDEEPAREGEGGSEAADDEETPAGTGSTSTVAPPPAQVGAPPAVHPRPPPAQAPPSAHAPPPRSCLRHHLHRRRRRRRGSSRPSPGAELQTMFHRAKQRQSIVAAVAIAAACTCGARPATADSIAESLYDEALGLMKAGDFRAACPKLAASFKREPLSGTLITLGQCYENSFRVASAWVEYRKAIGLAQQEGRPAYEERARELAEAVEPKLSRMVIEVPEKVPGLQLTLGGEPVDPATFGVRVAVDAGPQELVASAPGYRSWTKTIMVAGQGQLFTVQVPVLERVPDDEPEDEPDVTPAPRPPVPAPAPPPPKPPVDEGLDQEGGIPTWAWVSGGLGLVVGGVSLGMLGWQLSTASEIDEACPDRKCEAGYDPTPLRDQEELAHGLFVGLGAASIVGLGTAIIGIAIGSSSDDPAPSAAWSVEPVAGPSGGGVRASFSF